MKDWVKDRLDRMKGFRKRLLWFLRNRRDLNKCIAVEELNEDGDILLSLTPRDRLVRILHKMLDEQEFLASGGRLSLHSEPASRRSVSDISSSRRQHRSR